MRRPAEPPERHPEHDAVSDVAIRLPKATDLIGAIRSGAKAGMPSATGIRMSPPRAHQITPYPAPQAAPRPMWLVARPPNSQANRAPITALLKR